MKDVGSSVGIPYPSLILDGSTLTLQLATTSHLVALNFQLESLSQDAYETSDSGLTINQSHMSSEAADQASGDY